MKTFRQLALWAALGLSFAGAAQAQEFTVSGSKIYTPSGAEYVMNGANVGLWTDNATATHVNLIKNHWRFNCVRVFLKLANNDANTNPTDALLDKYVNAYTTDTNGPKTVVMLEFHDKSGSFYRDGETPSKTDLRNAWIRIANRYKNNPYVWFNIMNEPGGGSNVAQEWYDLHLDMIQTIRAQGAKNIIVCDGQNFASEENNSKANFVTDAGSAALTYGQALRDADPQKRLVFGLHTYVGWNYPASKLLNFVDRVHAKGLPLIVGEYAATTGNSLGDYDVTEAARAVFEVSKARKVGKLVWHYWNWDGNALCTSYWGGADGGAINRTDGTRPTNLTWLGERLWDDARGLTPPATGIPLNRFDWVATSNKGGNVGAAIDSDPGTSWQIVYVNGKNDAPPTTSPDYFQVDLGSTQNFNQIVMDTRKNASSFVRDFKVWVSGDASNWTNVASVDNSAMGVSRVSFASQNARYIRVTGTRFGKDWGVNRDGTQTYVSWNIADFLVYRSGTYTPPATCNVELSRTGWTATATKRGTWSAEYEDKALDNNPNTRYASSGAVVDGDSFTVDMKALRSVSTIELNTGSSAADYPRKYEVFLSLDGTNWGGAVARDLGSPIIRVDLGSPRLARYIRVVNRQSANVWWSIHEFRVFGGGSCGTAGSDYDTTDPRNGVITARGENAPNEDKTKAFDNSQNTKWLDFGVPTTSRPSWIQYVYPNTETQVVRKYSIALPWDNLGRAPSSVRLLGVRSDGTFADLDTRTLTWTATGQKQTFSISNTSAYRGYRLEIYGVRDGSSANSVQIAEIEFLASAS